jgi:hypothetical protein
VIHHSLRMIRIATIVDRPILVMDSHDELK